MKKGDNNVFAGFQAGGKTHEGEKNDPNTFSDKASLNYNVFLGAYAGENFKAYNSTLIGAEAGRNHEAEKTGITMVGRAAGKYLTSGKGHLFLGAFSGAGTNNKHGSGNIFIGACTGYGVTTKADGKSKDNIFLGNLAGYNYDNKEACVYAGENIPKDIKNFKPKNEIKTSNTLGERNIFIGHGAGAGSLTSDNDNIFMGFQAGFLNSSGKENIFIGKEAGFYNTSADYNTFVGSRAGYNTRKGKDHPDPQADANSRHNTFMGWESGYFNLTGFKNVFIGSRAGYQSTRGERSVMIGNRAGRMYIRGKKNTIVGAQAGRGADKERASPEGNTFFGCRAGRHAKSNNNTFLGDGAGFFNGQINQVVNKTYGGCEKGGCNIAVGKDAGAFSKGSYNIFMGTSEEYRGRETKVYSDLHAGDSIFGVGPLKDDKTGQKSAGHTPEGNHQLNIGNLLIGKMPTDELQSPRLDHLPKTGGRPGGQVESGLIVNGHLCVRDQILKGPGCETSFDQEIQQMHNKLDRADQILSGKIQNMEQQNQNLRNKINGIKSQIHSYSQIH